MAGLGQVLHTGKEHVYTKHLQRMMTCSYWNPVSRRAGLHMERTKALSPVHPGKQTHRR